MNENPTPNTEIQIPMIPARKPKSPRSALILDFWELFLPCLCVIMLLFSYCFRLCNVSGDSMLPTLHDKETLLISNLFYEPAPGDIIVFHQTSETDPRYNEPIVKRVIATEGQSVRLDFTAGTLQIDGVDVTEDYIQLVDTLGRDIGEYRLYAEHHFRMEPMSDGQTHRIFEATVPDGCLFVMGDNRNNSSDSRSSVIGFVDARRVFGRVICRLTPLNNFGAVR